MKMSMQSAELRFAVCKCKWGQVVKLPDLKKSKLPQFQQGNDFNRALTDKTCTENLCVIFREKSQEVARLRM